MLPATSPEMMYGVTALPPSSFPGASTAIGAGD